MLIKCPECQLQVSDKAISCPHCGYPLKPQAKQRPSTRRKRLPNGFGQISFIKGQNLRKPFRAMVTVSKDENGKPVCKPLRPNAYFKTYNEAYEALMEYHKDPFKISSKITIEELYELWQKDFKQSHDWYKSLKTAWAYCSKIYKVEVRAIRIRHVKDCIENGVILKNGEEKKPTIYTQRLIRSFLISLLDYALEYDLIDHNYAKDVNMATVAEVNSNINRRTHHAFDQKTVDELWKISSDDIAAMILVQTYTGMRPQEITAIERDNLNLDEWYMVGGMKTKNGKERIIPIHEKIRSLILKFYDESADNKYLFPVHSYRMYHKYFKRLLPDNYPHDPRKTFITYAKKYKVNDFAIKRIVGHALNDVTEESYTERSVAWLHEELQKIIM